jgi:hypothetical protein
LRNQHIFFSLASVACSALSRCYCDGEDGISQSGNGLCAKSFDGSGPFELHQRLFFSLPRVVCCPLSAPMASVSVDTGVAQCGAVFWCVTEIKGVVDTPTKRKTSARSQQRTIENLKQIGATFHEQDARKRSSQ